MGTGLSLNVSNPFVCILYMRISTSKNYFINIVLYNLNTIADDNLTSPCFSVATTNISGMHVSVCRLFPCYTGYPGFRNSAILVFHYGDVLLVSQLNRFKRIMSCTLKTLWTHDSTWDGECKSQLFFIPLGQFSLERVYGNQIVWIYNAMFFCVP